MKINNEVFKKYLWLLVLVGIYLSTSQAFAGEADLKVPDLSTVPLIFSLNGRCFYVGYHHLFFWRFFGIFQYGQIKKMPVHKSMKDISELIYMTCKAYLIQQGKFFLILELLIGSS